MLSETSDSLSSKNLALTVSLLDLGGLNLMIQPDLLFIGFPFPFPDFEFKFEFEFKWFECLFDECF